MTGKFHSLANDDFAPRSTAAEHATAAREQRISEAVGELLAAAEEGKSLDVDVLLEEYSDVAAELTACVESFTFLHNVAPQLAGPSVPDDSARIEPLATLGDFRILREIGRGGMGVVYEAEQLSLGRRVALKVLPFAAMLDRQQLKRFKNEARAAATLDHPNIVAIHSVGEERGVHYYAMQLIEGQSLAEIMNQLRTTHGINLDEPVGRGDRTITHAKARIEIRQTEDPALPRGDEIAEALVSPTADTERDARAVVSTVPVFDTAEYFRSVAQLGAQAASALDHAHQNGILHRDVKPGNLLVDMDGKLQVTDFGLARMESEAGLTMTGDLLGTLAYMSPEQALAKRVVDHRSDIYSLGVTLYELLTLHPAYMGEDRQELLKKIAFDEPRRPHQLNSRIPHDLETIVCKAIEKSPDDRYATAQDLADDLERFLSDQPIQASRPNVRKRIAKWSRRNQGLVAGATAMMALLLVAAATSTVLIWQENEQTQAALDEKTTALGEKEAALSTAEENIRLAAEVIDRMLMRVGSDAIAHGDLGHAQTIVSEAVALYDQILQRSQDPQLCLRAARAGRRLGQIQRLRGRFDHAQQTLRQRIALLEGSAKVRELGTAYEVELAEIYNELGATLLHASQFPAAEKALQTALRIRERLVAQHHDQVPYQKSLADTVGNLGIVYWQTKRLEDAERMCRRACSIVDQVIADDTAVPAELSRKGVTLGNVALILVERGELDEAEQMVQKAFGYFQRAYDKEPQQPERHDELYNAHWNLTDIHIRQGLHAQAAHDVERIVQFFPRRMQTYADGVTLLLRSADLASQDTADSATSLQYGERAGQLLQQSQQATDGPPDMANDLAWQLANWPDTSFRDPRRAVQLAEKIVQLSPQKADYWTTLGAAQYRQGQWRAAVTSLQKSVQLSNGGRARVWLFLGMAHWQLAEKQKARLLYDKASKWTEDNQPCDEELDRLRNEVADLLEAADEARYDEHSDARVSGISHNDSARAMSTHSTFLME